MTVRPRHYDAITMPMAETVFDATRDSAAWRWDIFPDIRAARTSSNQYCTTYHLGDGSWFRVYDWPRCSWGVGAETMDERN